MGIVGVAYGVINDKEEIGFTSSNSSCGFKSELITKGAIGHKSPLCKQLFCFLLLLLWLKHHYYYCGINCLYFSALHS